MNISRTKQVVSEEERALVASKEECPKCGELLVPDTAYPELVKYCPNCYYEYNPFGM